jgi:transposase-like protein
MKTRFGETLDCPKCSKNGKFHRVKSRPVYECQWCGYQLSPMVNTPFEKSRTPLQKWFYAIYLFTTSRHGVPAKELQRQLSVTYKTAWRMGHQIRQYMADIDGDNGIGGAGKHVEIDETYVGGKTKGQGKYRDKKVAVFGMLERGGNIMTKVVGNSRRATLLPIIEANVAKGSEVSTDEYHAYKVLGMSGYDHATVNHAKEEWVRGITHTNTLDGFWARFKLSVRGTHIHISRKHMDKYLGEFEFRFNLRANPTSMLDALMEGF